MNTLFNGLLNQTNESPEYLGRFSPVSVATTVFAWMERLRMIGRGGKDVIHSGAGDDTIEIRDVKFKLMDGGTGRHPCTG